MSPPAPPPGDREEQLLMSSLSVGVSSTGFGRAAWPLIAAVCCVQAPEPPTLLSALGEEADISKV